MRVCVCVRGVGDSLIISFPGRLLLYKSRTMICEIKSVSL